MPLQFSFNQLAAVMWERWVCKGISVWGALTHSSHTDCSRRCGWEGLEELWQHLEHKPEAGEVARRCLRREGSLGAPPEMVHRPVTLLWESVPMTTSLLIPAGSCWSQSPFAFLSVTWLHFKILMQTGKPSKAAAAAAIMSNYTVFITSLIILNCLTCYLAGSH